MKRRVDGSGRTTAGASFFEEGLACANHRRSPDVQVFLFSISQLDASDLQRYPPFLSCERWKRANSFRRERDRLRCVAAGLLGNFCLWKQLGGGHWKVRLARNRYGKPYLEGNPVFFSLSHAGEWVACALADCPIGVDVERVRPVASGMYDLCLTPSEQRRLNGAPEQAFFQIWTMKESFGKLRGDGLNCGFQRFETELLDTTDENRCACAVIRDAQTGQIHGRAFTQQVGEDALLSVCLPPEWNGTPVAAEPVTLTEMMQWMEQPNQMTVL